MLQVLAGSCSSRVGKGQGRRGGSSDAHRQAIPWDASTPVPPLELSVEVTASPPWACRGSLGLTRVATSGEVERDPASAVPLAVSAHQ